MLQPRLGETVWVRVPGGRALHAVTHESWPAAICSVTAQRWLHPPRFGWQHRKHKWCADHAGRMRWNFWAPDYEEEATHEGDLQGQL